MQRPGGPGYNPTNPGAGIPYYGVPSQGPPNPNFGPPRPGYPGPGYGHPGAMPPQNLQQNSCFMPAATIRKLSNTTPPNFDPRMQ